MTFENGTVGCILNQGFYLEGSSSGVPSLILNNTRINSTGLGVYKLRLEPPPSLVSTIAYNGGGVEQDTDGTEQRGHRPERSGGVDGGATSSSCNNRVWAGRGDGGVGAEQNSCRSNASNVSWDTSARRL